MQPYVLVLFDSQHGTTRELAQQVALGVEKAGLTACLRRVPRVTSVTVPREPEIPEDGELYCSLEDLRHCAGLVLGSPTHFGNMTASMKYFWDQTVPVWLSGDLQNKPAGVFTSTGSLHGGQESTLLTMLLPLLHHGMIVAGLPYSEAALSRTRGGGTPYGASRHTGTAHDQPLQADEAQLAQALGARIASLAKKQG